jgi:hypothetical protein
MFMFASARMGINLSCCRFNRQATRLLLWQAKSFTLMGGTL